MIEMAVYRCEECGLVFGVDACNEVEPKPKQKAGDTP